MNEVVSELGLESTRNTYIGTVRQGEGEGPAGLQACVLQGATQLRLPLSLCCRMMRNLSQPWMRPHAVAPARHQRRAEAPRVHRVSENGRTDRRAGLHACVQHN